MWNEKKAQRFGRTDKMPVCCIIPPHTLESVAVNASTAARVAATETLKMTAQLAGNREAFALMGNFDFSATGGRNRTTYDGLTFTRLPGIVRRREADPLCGLASADEAHDGAAIVYDLLLTAFGRDSLDGRGQRLISTVNYGTAYCNTPEAPIWMGDLSFKSLGDVRVGDSVIGWSVPEFRQPKEGVEYAPAAKRRPGRPAPGRDDYIEAAAVGGLGAKNQLVTQRFKSLCRSTVLAVMVRKAPVVKVRMASGRTIRCTPDHKWLRFRDGNRGGSKPHHRFTEPVVGADLVHVIDPTPTLSPDKAWAAGYLAGIYDGEGSGIQIAQYEAVNSHICERIREIMRILGFPFSGDQWTTWFKGPDRKQHLVNFLNWCNPKKRDKHLDGTILSARWQKRDQIVSVEPDGESDVVSLTTSTGNYTAWGYASKNCNAFWNGRQMTYGNGDGDTFVGFTKSLSVIGHEFAHGLIQNVCPLKYYGQSGALNESFADVFGVMTEHRLHGVHASSDPEVWTIGRGILGPKVQGKGIRNMIAPGSAYDDEYMGKDPQPADMSKYIQTQSDSGGVHLNSGIPNRAFALTATILGGPSWVRAGRIWFECLSRYLTPDSIFTDAAAGTVRAAQSLFGRNSTEEQAVRSAWEAVKVPFVVN
jgi:Zn-dependent metalloprotease